MITIEHPYAGLILPDASDLDPVPYLKAAARCLARHEAGSRPRIDSGKSEVIGRDFGIVVTPQEDSDYGPRVLIEVIATNGSPPEDEMAARILSDTVLLALKTSEADILEWYAPDVLIDREDFIRLRSYVSPRRARSAPEPAEDAGLPDSLRAMLAPDPVPADDQVRPAATDRLAQYRIRMEQTEPQDRRLMSARWLPTGAVGVLSAPLAVFRFFVDLYRGMDIRLVSQALAVTALFVALYNTDRLQTVLHQLAR
ncbi:hypothetical protein [Ponticoccus alexandrii]|uniref:Uncharacterized protein n=1 Tax=Ponticoccus alexandrii TaxID=1943633 RepID=A0ABX7F8G8_9RHOB|nr:hypothetical protein [Ponticoccus alexandrii]ETA53810.1 hypothetical protein P279_01280 [Rhodobacteraceae bacterium PD-2]QRF66112.1 hypothetical protein GQA70_07175 [Ponticoccus alexandrii]